LQLKKFIRRLQSQRYFGLILAHSNEKELPGCLMSCRAKSMLKTPH
jgi:hypothetical protein